MTTPAYLISMSYTPGEATRRALESLVAPARKLTPEDSARELVAQSVPFNERLTSYIARRFGCLDTPDGARSFLRDASQAKGLELSSANLSQWLTAPKGEVTLASRSIFKLCLAMGLGPSEAAGFVYDCLQQDFLNPRDPEQCVYLFFLGVQELFPNSALARADMVIARLPEILAKGPEEGPVDATGYTRLLESRILELADAANDAESAVSVLEEYLVENAPLFTRVRRSASRTYDTFLRSGGVGITPLTELYRAATGHAIPEYGYLDLTSPCSAPMERRLLWGAAGRADWIARNGRDWDVLHDSQIRVERHAVERMSRSGYLRGNLLALLFFHFAFDNAAAFAGTDDLAHQKLFKKFYRSCDLTLADVCSVSPLHPRKPFDRLFLSAIAYCGEEGPVTYLNRQLEKFYSL